MNKKDNQTKSKEKRRSKEIPEEKGKIGSKVEQSRNEIQSKLKGRTLMVYFVLLNKRSVGVRELQRMLDLSSPSVARYHLDKLVELRLVENRNGVYHLIGKANLPILTSWILLGRFLLPRVLFVAIFFTILFGCYLIFFYTIWSKDSFFVILLSSLVIIYSWIDVYIQMKNKPI